MSNWKLEENVTDISDSKLLKEHWIEIEPDGWYCDYPFGCNAFFGAGLVDLNRGKEGFFPKHAAYRLDKLLAELPSVIDAEEFKDIEAYYYAIQLKDKIFVHLVGDVKQAIKACVQLLVLLKKEGDHV